jgi:hypothetical protein
MKAVASVGEQMYQGNGSGDGEQNGAVRMRAAGGVGIMRGSSRAHVLTDALLRTEKAFGSECVPYSVLRPAIQAGLRRCHLCLLYFSLSTGYQ